MAVETVSEPGRQVPIFARAQVLVVGGGSAGCCAALAAARQGAQVTLLERCAYLGGVSTGGFVVKRDFGGRDCPYGAIGGIPFEVWDRIEAAGGGYRPCPERIGSRDEADLRLARLFAPHLDHAPDTLVLDPEVVKVVYEAMLQEAGVEILLNGWFADPILRDKQVTGVLFECKEGRRAIPADIVIDTTGDGDVFARAGEDYEIALKESTVHFRMDNVDWDEILDMLEREPERLYQLRFAFREAFGMRHGFWTLGHARGIAHVNTNTDGPEVDVLDTRELTRVGIEMRAKNRRMVEYLRENQPGFENARLIDSAPMVGCRSSRRVKGVYRLEEEDLFALKSFDDSIMLGACFYRQHPKFYPDGKPEYVVGEVPYRCLVPSEIDGLLVGGRCISCSFEAMNWIRDLPFVMSSGQAAGIAAARCVESGVQPRALDAGKVQSVLTAMGVPFHRSPE